MGFAWSRCRRCGRTLTASARMGIGPECATKATVRVTETLQLMDAIDTLLAHGHRIEAMRRIAKTDLNLYATAVNRGAPLRAATKRLLLRQARELKETQP